MSLALARHPLPLVPWANPGQNGPVRRTLFGERLLALQQFRCNAERQFTACGRHCQGCGADNEIGLVAPELRSIQSDVQCHPNSAKFEKSVYTVKPIKGGSDGGVKPQTGPILQAECHSGPRMQIAGPPNRWLGRIPRLVSLDLRHGRRVRLVLELVFKATCRQRGGFESTTCSHDFSFQEKTGWCNDARSSLTSFCTSPIPSHETITRDYYHEYSLHDSLLSSLFSNHHCAPFDMLYNTETVLSTAYLACTSGDLKKGRESRSPLRPLP